MIYFMGSGVGIPGAKFGEGLGFQHFKTDENSIPAEHAEHENGPIIKELVDLCCECNKGDKNEQS